MDASTGNNPFPAGVVSSSSSSSCSSGFSIPRPNPRSSSAGETLWGCDPMCPLPALPPHFRVALGFRDASAIRATVATIVTTAVPDFVERKVSQLDETVKQGRKGFRNQMKFLLALRGRGSTADTHSSSSGQGSHQDLAAASSSGKASGVRGSAGGGGGVAVAAAAGLRRGSAFAAHTESMLMAVGDVFGGGGGGGGSNARIITP
eukprot:GHVU01212579.1.p1 GENE.GHVU01212579.1~~GHVU01212579.1.p1  ORF type:complete len:205 (+),score=52.27 GHVU01212579.1:640-1254(+)